MFIFYTYVYIKYKYLYIFLYIFRQNILFFFSAMLKSLYMKFISRWNMSKAKKLFNSLVLSFILVGMLCAGFFLPKNGSIKSQLETFAAGPTYGQIANDLPEYFSSLPNEKVSGYVGKEIFLMQGGSNQCHNCSKSRTPCFKQQPQASRSSRSKELCLYAKCKQQR